MNKIYKVRKEHTRRGVSFVEGTLDELIAYFSYTLQIGASHKPSINTHPPTIRSFISNLQRSYEVKEGRCFERTFVSLEKQDNG